MSDRGKVNNKKKIYHEMILGILLYSVVLGFFNDYTNILHTRSYSITFALAIVMQILTYLTLLLKDKVILWFRNKERSGYKYAMVFTIWFILFVSKFVFLEVIVVIFRQEVKISGFIGVLIIVVCFTFVQKLVELVDSKLNY